MCPNRRRTFWSSCLVEKPKLFWIFYIILLAVLTVITIWFAWKDGIGFDLQSRAWFLVFLLFVHAIFSPLCFYFRKKEQNKK